MTQEYFDKMKADLLDRYRDELCEPSVEAVNAAASLEEFVGVLKTFATLQHYKAIPRIDWIRKWFEGYEEELRMYGVYVDSYASLMDPPTKFIVLYGTSYVSLFANKPIIHNVILHDESKLSVFASGVAVVKVRQLAASKVSIINRARTATIKIRKI